jgi:hypothetical protein
MQVKAKINEARVSMVTPGQQATIRMDAFTDLELSGTVEKVNEYPAPTNFFNPNVKEYETIIKIHESPPGLRPGLTAEVKILIEQIDDALQLPVQAVFEYGGQHYCVLRDGDGYRAQEVDIGSTNDKRVVIRKGLEEGQQVALNAASYRDKVDLPELTPEQLAATGGRGKRRNGGEGARGPRTAGAKDTTSPAAMAEQIFAQYDKDRDGRIELDKLPEPLLTRMKAADTNGDGAVERAEFNAAAQAMRRRGGGEVERAEGRPPRAPVEVRGETPPGARGPGAAAGGPPGSGGGPLRATGAAP